MHSMTSAWIDQSMKLLTHNFLSSHIRGVTNRYPLKIEVQTVGESSADLDPDFLRHTYPKLDWAAFHEAALSLGVDLPAEVTPDMLEDSDFLAKYHHALLEVTLEEGALVCPETGRKFPVRRGIPNMLLNEDEC